MGGGKSVLVGKLFCYQRVSLVTDHYIVTSTRPSKQLVGVGPVGRRVTKACGSIFNQGAAVDHARVAGTVHRRAGIVRPCDDQTLNGRNGIDFGPSAIGMGTARLGRREWGGKLPFGF